jgi:hypothetical protein
MAPGDVLGYRPQMTEEKEPEGKELKNEEGAM